MSSIRVRPRADGSTGYVLQWREAGKQHTATFNDHGAAVRHQRILDAAGPDELRRILDAETPIHTVTLTEWCRIHIDTRTGIQAATRDRYRSYVDHDIDPVIGALPLSSVTEHSIARWVQTLATDKSGKTIRNKHAFLSGALAAAVRQATSTKPLRRRRLPRHDRKEMVFLSRAEFDLLLSHIPEYWRPLTVWLVATGTRFSEAERPTGRGHRHRERDSAHIPRMEIHRYRAARTRPSQVETQRPHHQPPTTSARRMRGP